MGTPSFTPALTYNPFAMLMPDARSSPTPTDRQASGALQLVLEANPTSLYSSYGSGWSADRYEQLRHYRGIIFIALRAYRAAMGACKFTLLRRVKSVKKSLAGPGQYSRDSEYQPVAGDEHLLAQILEQPGGPRGAQTMHDECGYLTMQHYLTGLAPAWAPHNADGKPVRFFALSSANMTQAIPMGSDPRYPKGAYRFSSWGANGMFVAGQLRSQATLPGEEVGFFTQPNPFARNLSLSPLQAGDREIDCLEAITQARWATFDHGVHIDKAFIVPGMGEDESAVLGKRLTQEYGGSRNAGRTIVLGGADPTAKIDVKMLAPNVREMDYGASYDQAAGVVASLFGVPKELINFGMDSNYSKDWAAKQRFYDDALSPHCRSLSEFLTRVLARPWEEYPGELRIEVEPQLPKNLETENDLFKFAVQQGLITYNRAAVRINEDPVGPDGDVPVSIYLAKQQQAMQPQPAPGMPGVPGADGAPPQPGAEAAPGAEQPPADEQPADDTPEGTQDAVTNAALSALGVGGDDAQPDAVAKALVSKPGQRQRSEGEVWQAGSRWYTKTGGRVVPAKGPGGDSAASAGAKTPEKPAVEVPSRDGTSPPKGDHDALAAKMLNGRPELALLGGDLKRHVIRGGASLKAFIAAGGQLPASLFAEGAKAVPAATPVARKTVLGVKTWSRMKADQHADKVAAHFGISRQQAHKLLIDAIVQVAKHAHKNGGTGSGTVTANGKQLKVNVAGVKPSPSGATPPRPSNPDGAGSRGAPVAKAMNTLDDGAGGFTVQDGGVLRRRKKRARRCVERVLKAIATGG